MKTTLLLLKLFAIALLFCQCSKDDLTDKQLEKKENFPESAKLFGQNVAKELNATVRNLHKRGVNYSKANKSIEFKENFYSDFYKSSPSKANTKGSEVMDFMSPQEFVKKFNSLTKIQIEFIEKIINSCGKSKSYEDFLGRLIKINKDIYVSVPEIQQERLFNITAVLYYCMKEMRSLEEQGVMIETPRSNMRHLLVKTRSESGGSFGDSCKKFLATVWVIAVGEPTPAGEIVASVITVFVAGVLLYEVITCSYSESGTRSGSNYKSCQEQYVHCTDYTPWQDCSTCLANCLVQGSWPNWMCL